MSYHTLRFCCSPSREMLVSTLTVLPLRSPPPSFTPLPASPQSHTPLPLVMEPSPPSPTSTEGPDASDSDSSVYTASSSSSSFSFSSSSSFYATSSSSTSDKVSQLDTLNQVGGACLSGNFWLSLSPFVPPCTQFPLPIATFPFLLLLRKRSAPFSLPSRFQ